MGMGSALCLLAMPDAALAGIRTEANTRSVEFTANANTYTISDASLWGPNGPGTLNVDWSLSQSQWDAIFGEPPAARLAAGGITKVCVIKCARFGAAAGLEFSAYTLPYLNAEIQPGTFDASVTFTPSVNNYQFEGLGVDFFRLDTDAGLGADKTFTVNAPSIKLDTGINVDASLDLFARACVVGCFLDEAYNLLSESFKLPLLQVDTLNSSARVFAPPTKTTDPEAFADIVSEIGGLLANPPSNISEVVSNDVLYADVGALLGARVGEELDDYEQRLRDSGNTVQADNVSGIRGAIEDSPITVNLSNPFTSDAEGQWGGENDGTATASIGGELLDLKLDVDQVIGAAFGLPNGGSLSLDDVNLGNPVIDASVTLVDVKVGPSVDLKTDLQLRPELMVDLNFTRGPEGSSEDAFVIIKGEIGKQSSYRGRWEDIPEIALIANPGFDEEGAFSLSSDPIYATPTFFVESTLSNRTYLDIGAELNLRGPSARIDIDGIDKGLSFDSGLSLDVETGSIAQVDIFNRSFTNPGTDWITDGITTGEALSFVAAGEVLFQARSVGEEGVDVAFSDNRVDQRLTVDGLIASEVERRDYDYTPEISSRILTLVDVSSNFINEPVPDSLFQFEDGVVESVLRDEYRIDAAQTAQVMTDGSLVVANATDRFVIEADGALELAAEHPYGSTAGDGSGGETARYGMTNLGTVEVHGDIYMGTGGVAAEDYVYRNGPGTAVDASTTIGATGRVKLDGRLENSEGGVIDNYGQLELTGIASTSQGEIINRYLADVDVYGRLALEATFNFGFVESEQNTTLLANTGTFSLHEGAQVTAASSGFGSVGQINNNGLLILKENSELTLESNSSAGGGLVLNNHFLIDNAGMLKNKGGADNVADSRIVNGQQGHDWSDYRNASDLVGTLLADRVARVGDRNADLRFEPTLPVLPAGFSTASATTQVASSTPVSPSPGSDPVAPDAPPVVLTAQYVAANNQARLAANIAAGAKQTFLSAMNSYITDSQERLDPLLAAAPAPFISVNGNPVPNYAGINFFLSSLNAEYVELRRDTFTLDPANAVRNAERGYGDALRSVAERRQDAAAIYAQIDGRLQAQADTGIGIIANRGTGVLENGGLLTNHSILLNESGGQVYNTANATLENSDGYIRNNGLLVNQGELVNTAGAAIDNGLKSVRDAMGVLELAELVNLGTFTNDGEIVNNDTMVNYGTLTNRVGTQDTRIVNNGVMTNVGTLNNAATLTNAQAAEFTNHNALVNDGMLVNNGVFNNGQYGIDPQVGLSRFIANANSFYDGRRRLIGFNNDIRRYDEQVRDSEAREALVELNLIPLREGGLLDPLLNVVIELRNAMILEEYNRKVAEARAETDVLKTRRGFATLNRNAAEQSIRNIDAVDREMLQREDGSVVAGDLFMNLARLASTNTAEIENNGTFINRGIFNNVATVTNNAAGTLENNGIFMVSEEGVVDNAGSLLIAQSSANDFVQSGMLVSNGTINNSGTIEISSGMLLNGTVNETATLTNSGAIRLTASEEQGTSAMFMNDGVLINQPFGASLHIGAGPVLAAQEGRGSANTFVNTGTVINRAFASIVNYGELINGGLIDNSQWSEFVSDGTLRNLKGGEIRFAESEQLNGFTVNDGLITMADSELLTLTGNLAGSGTFAGNVLIKGDAERDENGNFTTTVNPGNSPGLLTFNGDVESRNVDWIMEIWGTERGVSYDGININGDFTLGDGFGLTLLSWLDVDSMLDQTFTFFSVTGDLFNAAGTMITRSSFDFVDFSSDLMRDSWAGTWVYNATSGWNLNLSFIDTGVDLYSGLASIDIQARLGNSPSPVPLPASLWLVLAGFGGLVSKRRVGARVHSTSCV
jgi:hypothetical protein